MQIVLSSLRAFGEWYGANFSFLHSPYLIVACGCALALLCLYVLVSGEPPPKSKLRRYPHSALAVVADGSRDKSDKAWRRELSPEAYASLRQRITDEPNLLVSQGGLTDLFEYGVFRCAGCGAELYAGETKFEMGCGWPCFYTCKTNAVREQADADSATVADVTTLADKKHAIVRHACMRLLRLSNCSVAMVTLIALCRVA